MYQVLIHVEIFYCCNRLLVYLTRNERITRSLAVEATCINTIINNVSNTTLYGRRRHLTVIIRNRQTEIIKPSPRIYHSIVIYALEYINTSISSFQRKKTKQINESIYRFEQFYSCSQPLGIYTNKIKLDMFHWYRCVA